MIKMKNLNKISAIICAAAFALGITGCATKELDTNQYSDTAVTFASMAPNPVVRGGALTFYGSNLENVASVIIPGVDPITEIEVLEKGKVSSIRVITPVEGPEVGVVTLKTKDGQELVSKSELTYKEGIVFQSFEVKSPAYPGDVITLKGDYMHLSHHVIFPGGTEVEVEEGAERHVAKVVIPADAVNGKLIISDNGTVEGLFYSPTDLVMGKPTVTKASVKNVKVDDQLTVSGQHLEMISHFNFLKNGAENPETFGVDEFVCAADGKSITILVPEQAIDGEFKAVSFQGDEFVAGSIKCTMPAGLNATPQPVKAGETLTVSGSNLDVVAKVDFNGAADAAFTLDGGKLKITVPATAKDGDITLYHANGNKVTVPVTLVVPQISEITPLELFAGDEDVIIKGKDLDLVVKASIGTKEAAIKEVSATQLTLGTDVTSVGGKVTLELANGVTVVSEQEVVMKYHSKVIVTERPAAQHIGEEVVLKGTNMDLVESIFVGEQKVTKYSLRTADEIRFLMPWLKIGSYELKFVLYDGDEEVQADPIEVLLERQFTKYYEGSEAVAWNEIAILNADQVAALPLGSLLVINYTVMNPIPDGYTQIRMIGAGWSFNPEGSPIYQFDPAGSGIQPGEDGVITLTVDADLKTNYASGISLTGNGCIITKAEGIKDISQEITVFEGPCDMTWGDDGRFGLAYEFFKDLTPGAQLIFYIEHTKDWGQIQINDGWWATSYNFAEIGGSYIKTDIIGTETRVVLTLDAENLAIAQTNIGDYAGLVAGTKYASPSGKYSFVLQGSDMRVLSIAVLQ